jgi:SAM-dependent methyltransferase
MEIKTVPIAATEQEVIARHQMNRDAWEESATSYTTDVEKTIDFLRTGGNSLHPIEQRNLGSLSEWCRSAIHLQCASGKDTLSLWNSGVKDVTGLDISQKMIDNATVTAKEIGIPARWFCCDVLDAPTELDGSADLVYTGQGSVCWIHDLDQWAKVVARLLKPGGVFHVFDDHPMSILFDPESDRLVLLDGTNYFSHCEQVVGWPSSYIADDSLGVPPEKLKKKFVRLWPLADIFQSLRQAGLVIEYLGEHMEEYYDAFPKLEAHWRGRIPMTFSLKAKKPIG